MTNYWIFGKHAVKAALLNQERTIISGRFSNSAYDELTKSNIVLPKDCEVVDTSFFKQNKQLANAVHQGYAILVKPLDINDIHEICNTLEPKSSILVLDHITDPHNVGAIIRSAAAFNIDGIIICKDNSPNESGQLAKTAAGALEVIKIYQVTNLARALQDLKKSGFWIFGMDADANYDISKAKEYDKKVLILGSEGKGMRHLTKANCDMLLKINISNKVESLNVSAAAVIAMYTIAI